MASSRLIFLNLPPSTTPPSLSSHLSSSPSLPPSLQSLTTTDLKLVPKRRFAFVGYSTVEEATAVKEWFDGTFWGGTRVRVEFVKDESLPVAVASASTSNSASGSGTKRQRLEDNAAFPPSSSSNSTPLPTKEKENKRLQEFMEVMKTSAIPEVASNKTLKANEVRGGDEDLIKGKGKKRSREELEAEAEQDGRDGDGDGEDLDDSEWLKRRQTNVLPEAEEEVITGQGETQGQGHGLGQAGPSTSTSSSGFKIHQPNPNPNLNPNLSPEESLILQTHRLFIRNLSFLTTTTTLTELFSQYGEILELHMPVSKTPGDMGKSLGTAFILFKEGEEAVRAWKALDGRTVMGRLIHILPGRAKVGSSGVVGVEEVENDDEDGEGVSRGVIDGKVLGKEVGKNIKKEQDKKRKEESGKGLNWGTLYMNSDAVASSVADRMGIKKSDILNPDSTIDSSESDPRLASVSSAVKLALAETSVISETKTYFSSHGVNLEAFSGTAIGADGRPKKIARSTRILLVKNIPYGTTLSVLTALFEPHGKLKRVLMPPAGTLGVVEYEDDVSAGRAFKAVNYRRLGNAVIYLEKGPEGLFKEGEGMEGGGVGGSASGLGDDEDDVMESGKSLEAKKALKAVQNADTTELETTPESGSTLFIKNLSFATTQDRLSSVFSSLPSFSFARISTKPDPKNPNGPRLSMGFGFLGFKTKEAALKAMGGLKGFKLDGHDLEFKFAQRDEGDVAGKGKDKKVDGGKKVKTTKIIVKNVPFEASKKDIRDLFSAYGTLKSCRIPKKHNSGGRGFAFLDFALRSEAETAMEALKHTHLLGRHLVIEWAQDDEEAMRDVDKLREKVKQQYGADQGNGERMGKRKKLAIRDGDAPAGEGDGMEVD